jgi:hypothetical protein
MCNWFYDLHFCHDRQYVRNLPRQGESFTVRFRIMNYDFDHTLPILRQAELPDYPESERAAKAYPRHEENGLDSFEAGTNLEAPDHSRIWRPFHNHPLYLNFGLTDVRLHGNGRKNRLFDAVFTNPHARCRWDRQCGRTGTSSLQVVTSQAAVAGWSLPLFEAPRLVPGKRYKLTVYIRTEKLSGKGATLAYLPDAYQHPWVLSEKNRKAERRPVFASRWVTGTSPWTRVEIVTTPMTLASRGAFEEYQLCNCSLQPILWHQGRGQAWFDDFQLEELPG